MTQAAFTVKKEQKHDKNHRKRKIVTYKIHNLIQASFFVKLQMLVNWEMFNL